MATTLRGSRQYSGTSLPNHDVPLPVGSVAGDWVALFAVGINTAYTMTMPGTTVIPDTDANTMTHAMSKKQLTSTDISNGYLRITSSSAQNICAAIAGFSASGGIGAPGTVTAKSGSSAVTVADGDSITSDGSQIILVVSEIKHSGNPQSFVGDSPATTTLETVWQNGGGLPGIHLAYYTGAAADRTSTWGVASGNGVGFQVPILQSTPPVPSGPTVRGVIVAGALVEGATVRGVISGGVLVEGATVRGVTT